MENNMQLDEAKKILKNAGYLMEDISMHSSLYDFYRYLKAKAPKTGYDFKIEDDDNSITVKFKNNVAKVTLEKFDEDEDAMLYVEANGEERAFYNEHTDYGPALQFIIKNISQTNESINERNAGYLVEATNKTEIDCSNWHWVKSMSSYNNNYYYDTLSDVEFYLEECDEDYGDYLYYACDKDGEKLKYLGYTNREGSVENCEGRLVLDPGMPT